jgi:hypothetical protein
MGWHVATTIGAGAAPGERNDDVRFGGYSAAKREPAPSLLAGAPKLTVLVR